MISTMKTFMLLLILSLLLIWIGGVVAGQTGATIAFIIALCLNFFSYWYSDRLILTLYSAREVRREELPQVYEILEELVQEAKLPMPRVYLMKSDMANAFATGRNPAHSAVCVTTGILNLLNRDELKGVLAHELAHIKNRDTLIQTITATIAMAIMFLASIARWAAIFGGYSRDRERGANILVLLIISILAPIAALIIQMAISRAREFYADSKGAGIAKNPMGLASALRKLEQNVRLSRVTASPATSHLFIINPLRGGGIATLFSTHPPIAVRVERLYKMAEGIR